MHRLYFYRELGPQPVTKIPKILAGAKTVLGQKLTNWGKNAQIGYFLRIETTDCGGKCTDCVENAQTVENAQIEKINEHIVILLQIETIDCDENAKD
jgi:hypothetical protein